MKILPQKNICLSIAEATVEDALLAAGKVAAKADIIEIRLDTLRVPEVEPFIASLSIPLLFTNRPEWECGHYSGPEKERVDLLCAAVVAGAAYVDLELRATPESWQQLAATLEGKETTLITSWHNFDTTPDDEELQEIFWQMAASGADVGKIVTTAHGFSDVLRVLHLQLLAEQENFPLAAFCMGEDGRISRAATLELGGVLTYAAADQASATAPGQLTVEAIKKIQRCLHD